MNPELAKELKDAGFPQDGARCKLEHDHTRPHNEDVPQCWCNPKNEVVNGTIITIHNLHTDGNQWEDGCQFEAYRPTLEELIEACGAYFMLSEEGKDDWRARGGGLIDSVRGTTPKEAVALLWLKINKKT